MNLAVLTPLPPVRSGVAHYCSILLPALAKEARVTAVVDQPEFVTPAGCEVQSWRDFDPSRFDAVICHLGNNPYHQFAYAEAMARPAIIVLHDFVLHHLIVESTLARGDSETYIEQLRENHGAAGAALARGRKAGFHGEIGNFLFPASATVAQRSKAIIVHNRYAGESLRNLGVTTPIAVVGHPWQSSGRRFDREEIRRELGYKEGDVVVGLFGFLTAAKRPEVVFEGFSSASRRDSRLKLLIVGEPSPDVDLVSLALRFGTPLQSWRALGYVGDEDFDRYLAAVDQVVNLRYPSAGETSGALIRVFAAGKPVAVSDYAQFVELPAEIVTKVPFGPGEAAALADFLMAMKDSAAIARAQHQWLRANASLEDAVRGTLRALEGANDIPEQTRVAPPALPVLAGLQLDRIETQRDGDAWKVHMVVRNSGPTLLRAGVYGEPAYRVLVKAFAAGHQIFDRWLPLPCDVAPGESAPLEFRVVSAAPKLRIELSHAIEGVPHFDFAPFATAEPGA